MCAPLLLGREVRELRAVEEPCLGQPQLVDAVEEEDEEEEGEEEEEEKPEEEDFMLMWDGEGPSDQEEEGPSDQEDEDDEEDEDDMETGL